MMRLPTMNFATVYDAINGCLFLSSGGSGRLRQTLVDALDLHPGDRVLELGCGTGQVTQRLLAAGADVVAVDSLPVMLAAARRRAPGATYIEGDALRAELGDGYDRVVLSFVLHGRTDDERLRLLRRSAAALAPGGRVGVLEWALPPGRLRAMLWRGCLHALERTATGTQRIIEGVLEREAPAAGLRVLSRHPAAGGRTQILILGLAD